MRHWEALTLVLKRCSLIPLNKVLQDALVSAIVCFGSRKLLPPIQSNLNASLSTLPTKAVAVALDLLADIPILLTAAETLATEAVQDFLDRNQTPWQPPALLPPGNLSSTIEEESPEVEGFISLYTALIKLNRNDAIEKLVNGLLSKPTVFTVQHFLAPLLSSFAEMPPLPAYPGLINLVKAINTPEGKLHLSGEHILFLMWEQH